MPAVGEFTIEPILTPGELDLACWFLLRTIPSLEARWRGPGFFHERLAGESPMMLAAKREDEMTVMDKNLDAPAVLSLGLARQRRRSWTPRHEVDCAIDSMRAG